MRIGSGHDTHRLVLGRPLILGGIEIPFSHGLDGHSDADVVLHCITDALLGAVGLGDIGECYPDTDPAYKNYDSSRFVIESMEKIVKLGWEIANVDVTIPMEQFGGELTKSLSNLRFAANLDSPDGLRIRRDHGTLQVVGIVEPLSGVAANCPVHPDTALWLLSPRGAIQALVNGIEPVSQLNQIVALVSAQGDRILCLHGMPHQISRNVLTVVGAQFQAQGTLMRHPPQHAPQRYPDSVPEVLGENLDKEGDPKLPNKPNRKSMLPGKVCIPGLQQ